MNNKGEIIIYQTEDFQTQIDVRLEEETVWLNQYQMAELFQTDRTSILRHLKNIYNSGELDEISTCAKIAQVQNEGTRIIKRNIHYYNLDAIISVGYKVNSIRGTQFRIWANKVLKEYLLKGYSLNERLLKEKNEKIKDLQKTISLISSISKQGFLTTDENESLISLLEKYSTALNVLDNYDYQKLNEINKSFEVSYKLEYDEVMGIINQMRNLIGNSALFGKEKDYSLKSSISAIYQTFDGNDLYPSLEEKAAHLLYFLVKNHSFVDGNKRIAAAIFLYFLDKNNFFKESQDTNIVDNSTLVALTLMIANSNPKEIELIINVVTFLLQNK